MRYEGELQSRYQKMEQEREPFLRRARRSSELTIPSLLPQEGHSLHSDLPTPYQSVGSRAVNNLASKMMLILLPPGTPFFRLHMSEQDVDSMGDDDELKTEVGGALGRIEREAAAEFDASNARMTLPEGMMHLINDGNVLLHTEANDGTTRVYKLDSYVVKRDYSGKVLDIIAKDTVTWHSLDAQMQETLGAEIPAEKRDEDIDMYTTAVLDPASKDWHVWQEIKNIELPGSRGVYKPDDQPFDAVRRTAINGEDYGRGYIEEHFGDLVSLDGLSRAILEASAAASRILGLVDPNGQTDPTVLTEAPNMSFRYGRAQDVTFLGVDKFADMQVALAASDRIEARLSKAFLFESSVQRQAERVTAEEIRFVAQELEDALGGIYTVLGLELQLPMIKRQLRRMARQGDLPRLPKNVKPQIITGLAALGRNQDVQRLRQFLAVAREGIPQEILAQYVVVDNYLKRVATGVNLDTTGLIRSTGEVDQRNQAAAASQAEVNVAEAGATAEATNQAGGNA